MLYNYEIFKDMTHKENFQINAEIENMLEDKGTQLKQAAESKALKQAAIQTKDDPELPSWYVIHSGKFR